MSQLFPAVRRCCCCTVEAKERDTDPNRPKIMGISFVIYRRSRGKKQLRAAGRVQVCEQCFVRAMASQGRMFQSAEGQRFAAAVKERLVARYTLMAAEDNEGPDPSPDSEPRMFEDAA